MCRVGGITPRELPHTFRGDSKQQHVHALDHFCRGKLWPYGGNRFRELVVLESLGIAMVLVEVLHEVTRARPHAHTVRRVAQVVRKTATKVAGSEYEHLALLPVRLVWEHPEACGSSNTCPKACTKQSRARRKRFTSRVSERREESGGEEQLHRVAVGTRSTLGQLGRPKKARLIAHARGARCWCSTSSNNASSWQRQRVGDKRDRLGTRRGHDRVRRRGLAASRERGTGHVGRRCSAARQHPVAVLSLAALCSLSQTANWRRRPSNLRSPCPRHSFLSLPILPVFLFLDLTMPVQDRTNEFRACVDSIRNRSSYPARGAEQKQRLLQTNGKAGGSKSEFTRMASAIGKDISSTTVKLGKLAQREYHSPFVHVRGWYSQPYSREAENTV